MHQCIVKEDVASVFRKDSQKNVYARAGDIVTEVAEHGDMLIVENQKGFRFPIKSTNLTIIFNACSK